MKCPWLLSPAAAMCLTDKHARTQSALYVVSGIFISDSFAGVAVPGEIVHPEVNLTITKAQQARQVAADIVLKLRPLLPLGIGIFNDDDGTIRLESAHPNGTVSIPFAELILGSSNQKDSHESLRRVVEAVLSTIQDVASEEHAEPWPPRSADGTFPDLMASINKNVLTVSFEDQGKTVTFDVFLGSLADD